MTPQEEQLIIKIETAFKDIKREEGITFHQALAMDNRVSYDEQMKARELDTESSWQEVSDDMIKNNGVLAFFDKKGLRYYLPAFMCCSIRYPNCSAEDSVIFNLFPDAKEVEVEPYIISFVKKLELTKKQCEVIYDFLKYVEDQILREWEGWSDTLEAWKKSSK